MLTSLEKQDALEIIQRYSKEKLAKEIGASKFFLSSPETFEIIKELFGNAERQEIIEIYEFMYSYIGSGWDGVIERRRYVTELKFNAIKSQSHREKLVRDAVIKIKNIASGKRKMAKIGIGIAAFILITLGLLYVSGYLKLK